MSKVQNRNNITIFVAYAHADMEQNKTTNTKDGDKLQTSPTQQSESMLIG